MGIHCGKRIKPGGRYDRTLRFLGARGASGATTREIVQACRVCAVNSVVAELRAMGYRISCESAGMSEDGGKVYRYRLEGIAEPRDLFEAAS